MGIINVSTLSSRVVIPHGIKIEKYHTIERGKVEELQSIEVISFRYEDELVRVGSKEIKGTNFNIENSNFNTFQWEGNGITFEELWDKILEAWEDYQECMAFPSLILGYNTGPGCILP